ncbi:DedA family protein [Brevibacillus sp. SYP-B805]|uniref:DedA family protein n=1 Tax=Brevibacillus sp. SYP-B805 TaxID=1578199 RepID=UPI0013EBD5D6|nr:DedA family protein [Brevibacillus sp. SYP-B805]NGQ94461.1 DedA family protein [Brevibacillus sp. SYP-B805]
MITAMWETIVKWAVGLGGIGVFVSLSIEGAGLPFPGDVMLAFFGYLSSRGQLSLPAVILIATLGSSLGSIIPFALGRRYGFFLLRRYARYLLISSRSMEQTVRLSNRYGVLVLLLGRLFPGIRALSSYIAGIGLLPWPVFLLCSTLGFALFCIFWTLIGYLLGENWRTVVGLIHKYLVGIAIGAIILIVLFLTRRMGRK